MRATIVKTLSPPSSLHSEYFPVFRRKQLIETQVTKIESAVDQQLQDLIEQICRFEATSPQGRKALTRLLILVQRHEKLYRSSHPDYFEALNRTLEWICNNIQSFEARSPSVEQSLIRWVNGYLKWRIRDLYTPDTYYKHNYSLDNPITNEEGETATLQNVLPDPKTMTSIESIIEAEQQNRRVSIGDAVFKYIEQDPKDLLKNCYPKKQPECHCQILAIRLLLEQPPHKISEIAREYNISNQTLYSHWKRKCLPLLQTVCDQITQSFGV
ncbi:MAG: helix-turn-helix domain-containing protein [Cyanobacteriota bacterium]|nr:helix-turn-helix domain-containing protein [Cyanobacteriota bacterium]